MAEKFVDPFTVFKTKFQYYELDPKLMNIST